MAAKTPAPRPPKAPPEYGVFGNADPVNEKYLFGTEAEIRGRIATGYETNPAEVPPSFTQIRPGGGAGNANEPDFKKNYSGSNNYDGDHRRYA
jgi:hypothetical protein